MSMPSDPLVTRCATYQRTHKTQNGRGWVGTVCPPTLIALVIMSIVKGRNLSFLQWLIVKYGQVPKSLTMLEKRSSGLPWNVGM